MDIAIPIALFWIAFKIILIFLAILMVTILCTASLITLYVIGFVIALCGPDDLLSLLESLSMEWEKWNVPRISSLCVRMRIRKNSSRRSDNGRADMPVFSEDSLISVVGAISHQTSKGRAS